MDSKIINSKILNSRIINSKIISNNNLKIISIYDFFRNIPTDRIFIYRDSTNHKHEIYQPISIDQFVKYFVASYSKNPSDLKFLFVENNTPLFGNELIF